MGYIVFGNDERMNEVRKLLIAQESADTVCVFPPNMMLLMEDIKKIPRGSRVYARGISEDCKEIVLLKEIKFKRYDDDEFFLEENSKLTAEATLSIMLSKCQTLLKDKKILLIGFGHSGREIARYLYALCCNFTIMSSKKEGEIYAHCVPYDEDIRDYDIIVNTAPTEVIKEEKLCNIKRDCVIIDISSKPYGLNHQKAREFGIDSDIYPALPAKYKTEASAKIIVDILTGGNV